MPVFPTIGSRTTDPTDIVTSVASTLPRNAGINFVDTAAIGASGTLHLTAIDIPFLTDNKVTSISYRSGAQAAVAPTAWWFALYTAARVLVAQTPDQTSTAWAANTTKTVAFATPYNFQNFTPGMYYVGILMVGGTIISTIGTTAAVTGAAGLVPIIAGSSSTGLTTTAPDPAGAITVGAGMPLAWVI
jgi:hypothetical protein